jgi:hypothetical protein
MMVGTANTHWLNSIFLFFEQLLIGEQEWMLRLHSVLAAAAFAFVLVRIYKDVENGLLLLIPVSLLLFNAFLFDYFSLARGYGLSVLFEAMAIYYLYKQPHRCFNIYLFLSLATFSNYSCIYFMLAYFMVDVFHFIRQGKWTSVLKKDFYIPRWPFFLLSAWALPNILFIKYVTNDLREGEHHGFFQDTIGKFLQRSYPDISLNLSVLLASVCCLFLLYFYLQKRIQLGRGLKILLQVLFINFLLIEAGYFIFNIPFPYGRTAIFYMVPFLFALSSVLCLSIAVLPRAFHYLLPVLLSLFCLTQIVNHRQWNRSVEYWKQQGIPKCFNDLYRIEGSNIKRIRIGMSIDHYGSFLNYYKQRNPALYPDSCFVYSREGYDRMKASETAQFAKQDYLLMLEDYHSFLYRHIPQENLTLVHHYPDMKSDLLKVSK